MGEVVIMPCRKCGKRIDRNKESVIVMPGTKQKVICTGCWHEWELLKDRHWHNFLSSGKVNTPTRGLNAYQQKNGFKP
jgi:hypothetical protein